MPGNTLGIHGAALVIPQERGADSSQDATGLMGSDGLLLSDSLRLSHDSRRRCDGQRRG